MKQLIGIVVISVFSILISGCKDNNEVFIESGEEYFPMVKGLYTIYAVDSILIQAELETFDTSSFFIKEIQDSIYIDAEGNTAVILKRLKRNSMDEPWTFLDNWKMYRNSSRAHRVEENEDLLVLSIPPSLNSVWNVNAYNTRESWLATFSEIHQSEELNTLFFDSTLTVQQEREITLVNRRFEERKYAKNVGLIERAVQILEFNTVVPEGIEPDSSQIDYGVYLNYNIIEYGKE